MKKAVVTVAIIAFFGFFLLIAAGMGYNWNLTGKAPDQPIAFPHTIHVSKLGIACDYCHIYVEKSRHAGAPPLEKCMACHKAIATEKGEIKKLTRFYDEKKPVAWNRVYSLPDHVYFSHKRHVKEGVKCINCHGDVGSMKKVRRVKTLDMGWCVSCHRERGAPLDCATCHK